MKATIRALGFPLLLSSMLLLACSDEADPHKTDSASTEPYASSGDSAPPHMGSDRLTAEELAAESGTAALPDPKPERPQPQTQPRPEATSDSGEPSAEEIAAESMAAILSALAPDPSEGQPEPGPDAVTELDWDALIPAEWQPEKLMEEYDADELEDDDPRALELMEKLRELWKAAPVVPALNGRQVKLPGFIVPLETDAEKIGEFLLVPYYGACIHVPPPPANQTVYVVMGKGREYEGELFDTVWITGTLTVESYSGDLADAGYRMEATKVEPFE